jgi:acetaldehyde dehydrogenase / alcohol dehydrogenase
LLPYVIQYNAQPPTKFAAFPQYEYPMAGERYAVIAKMLGLPASTTQEAVNSLVNAVKDLMKQVNIPLTLAESGVNAKAFEKELREMSDIAFNDQTTGTNPRMPLVSEIEAIYREAYGKL